jgi:hypothetical protein
MSRPIAVTAPLASPATWDSSALSKRTEFDGTRVPARGCSHHHVRMDVIAISRGRPLFRGPQLTCYALAY